MLEKNRKEWEKWEIDFILDNYENMTWKEIGNKINRTENSIQMKSKRLGIKKLPYYCNKDFFEIIDTEEKAYWLGFITADGWISHGKNNSAEVAIQLAIKDIEHLKKFNQSINGNYRISTGEKRCPLGSEQLNKFCLIRIYSIKMANDLLKYNITANKTYNIQLVNLSDEMMSHFIRGYFDGDGSVYIHSYKQRSISAKFTSASKLMTEQMRILLLKNNINTYIVKTEGKKNQTVPIYEIMIGGMKNVDVFLDYIYKDATIYLDRKLKRAIELYKKFEIEQRLPLHSEMSDFYSNWERKLES